MSIGAVKWSYLKYGCTVLADNQRSYAYHLWACANDMYPSDCQPRMEDCACEFDDAVVPPVDPVTDPAPWYDANVPESSEFIGLMILSVDGAEDSSYTREAFDAFNQGSILARPRIVGRSFVVRGIVMSTSCEGNAYGIEWIRKILEDESCQCSSSDPCETCGEQRMTLRKFCPAAVGDCDNGLRTWDSVGVVDGISKIDNEGLEDCCCVAQEVTFTLQSEGPYSFACSDVVIDEVVDPEVDLVRCYDWQYDCLECCEPEGCDRCGYDALCTCFPPESPKVELLTDDCWCAPLESVIKCVCIDDIGTVYDTALSIDIFSGAAAGDATFTDLGMRNVRVRVWDNPDSLPCPVDLDTYEAFCTMDPRFDLRVSYIPSNATLSIDGRKERVVLDCDGVCRPYAQVVSSTTGSIFPLIANCDPVTVCVEFDKYNGQYDATVPKLPSTMTISTHRRWRN